MSTTISGAAPLLREPLTLDDAALRAPTARRMAAPADAALRAPAPRRPRGPRPERGGAAVRSTRVFAVDGRPLVRSGLAAIARRALGGGALALTDLNQAVAARGLIDGDPEALLLGLRGGEDPAVLVAAGRRIAPIVICVLDRSDPALVRAAIAAEADGYMLSEQAAPETLRATLDAVRGGRDALPPELGGAGAGRGPGPGGASAGGGRGAIAGPGAITERCREVLQSLADGLHDHEIAERLGISTSSVRKHVANAQERLEARTRTQAVARAARAGLL